MKTKLKKSIYAIDESRRDKSGNPNTRRFTAHQWKLMAGDDNLKAGRWKRIDGPSDVKPVKLEDKTPKVDATKTAIDLAKEKGINILSVSGTGTDGRILKADVEEYLLKVGIDEEE